jgi:serine/threonine-protein kinase
MTTGSTTPSTALQPFAASAGTELAERYRLVRAIGQGASASVWLADDLSLKRPVAIKMLHQGLAADTAFLDRFRAEAQSAAGLNHPNVLAVHDWGEAEVPFLVMEHLAGGSLRSMLDSGARLSPSQAIGVGLEACRGLHFAHRQRLVHRDIKPANLLFGADARLRIADFGLARALAESGWTEPNANLVGTARYASPEQAQGKRLTGESDVYSLGLTLLESITGEPAFTGDTAVGTLMARVENDVVIPDLPERLAEALQAMTRRDPEERPDSAKAGVALLKAADGLPRPEALRLVGPPKMPVPETARASDTAATNLDTDIDATKHVTAVEQTEIQETPVVQGPADDGPARRWPWLVVTTLLLAVAGWFAYNQVEAALPADVAVPDVVGFEREAALTELGDSWILVQKLDRVADVDQGSVIRTNPAAGELLAEGETLEYWVSLGRPLIRVPVSDIVGRTEQQAAATLESIGLTVGAVERVNDESIGTGLVIAATSEAAEVPQGDSVNLTVSLGPVTREVPAAQAGVDIAVYIEALTERGLGNTVGEIFDEEVPAGEVISITPEPGTAIERGEVVDIVLSLGPEPVAVPDISGELIGPAIERLELAGFIAIGDGNFRCEAVGTDPPEGTLVQPGEPITVILTECEP